jgi:pimeloyl-ACP methyl ester carboxylesterase
MALDPDNVVSLSDGRTLGYSECGDPAGLAVLVFPDTPGSRLDLMAPEFDGAAGSAGVRLLVVERPGIGLSDLRPGRTLLDWPVDVVGFAEALGLSRFSVLGVGGGGPYALACGLRIAHRLKSVGVVASWVPADLPEGRAVMTPRQRNNSTVGRYFPWLLEQRTRRLARQLVAGSERLIEGESSQMGAPDQQLLADPHRRGHRLTSLRAGFRRGEVGTYQDLLLLARPWGFALGDIPMVVNLWLGGQDRTVLPAAGYYLAGALNRSESRVYPEEGHLSLLWNRLGDVLNGLLATAMREAGRPVG